MITEQYDPLDTRNNLPIRLLPQYENLSPNAKALYDFLPPVSWMTKETLARAIGCRTSAIKSLKEELEAAGLITILFNRNGNRSNPRHELIKTTRIGTPICKHIKNAYCFSEWRTLDRNSQIECYLKSDWNIVPFEPKQKQPHEGFSTREWQGTSAEEKMDFFFKNQSLNVGLVVCSHTVVVDVDTKENEWITQESFKNTLTVSTPQGFHFYFRNDALVTTSVKTVPNIDIRGAGNYVVLPPSIHPSGEPYTWENIAKPSLLPIEFRREWRERDFKRLKLISHQELLAKILKGMRNDSLWSYGRSLRCKGKNFNEIEIELLQINDERCVPKLSSFEVKKLAAHVWTHRDKRNFIKSAAL
jgi:hypothetical protein